MLVRAFQVHERRIAEAEVLGQHGAMAGARLEPDVEDVSLLAERRAAALGADSRRGCQFLHGLGEPGVGAVGAEQGTEVAHGLGVQEAAYGRSCSRARGWARPTTAAG